MIKKAIFLSALFLILSLVYSSQYSGSQTVNEKSNIPLVREVGLAEDPQIEEEEEQTKPDERGNETDDDEQTNETTTQEDNQVSTKGPTQKMTAPNVTGPLVAAPISYNMKIIFNYIDVCEDHENYLPSGDGEWDLIAYVQGKKVDLTAASDNRLWDISSGHDCNTRVHFKPGTEVTVEIPPEFLETPRDARPLSIFTVGSEVDGCLKSSLPSQLDNVIQILSDKSTTRPYYADAKDKIAKIQSDINAGLNDACLGNVNNKNDILGTISGFYSPPGYEYGLKAGTGRPDVAGPIYHRSSTGDFGLWYSVSCPQCAIVRDHR